LQGKKRADERTRTADLISLRPRNTVVYTHRECFDEAATRFDPPVEKVEIPYEETTLPSYLFKVGNSGRSRPLLLLNMGSDGDTTGM